jgi:hypothetical protein
MLLLTPLYILLLAISYTVHGKDEIISTELCHNFCIFLKKTCVRYNTPVAICYNGQSLFPNDPSWGGFDVKDDVLDDHSFSRKFYNSEDGTCREQTDEFTLPFNECIGPFGQPRPWGTFTLIRTDDGFVTVGRK